MTSYSRGPSHSIFSLESAEALIPSSHPQPTDQSNAANHAEAPPSHPLPFSFWTQALHHKVFHHPVLRRIKFNFWASTDEHCFVHLRISSSCASTIGVKAQPVREVLKRHFEAIMVSAKQSSFASTKFRAIKAWASLHTASASASYRQALRMCTSKSLVARVHEV